MRMVVTVPLCALGLLVSNGCAHKPDTTQEELVRRTQELASAVAGGDKAPWKKYFADDCMFFDEQGHKMDKKALVAGITPLPEGYSGTIEVGSAQSHIERNVAILSYELDETEIVFGQKLKARYHETDTWMRRNGEWKIAAGQVLRYYEDPAAGTADAREVKDYAGKYDLAPGKTATVSLEGSRLFWQQGEKPKVELLCEAGPIFFRKGVEGRTLFRSGVNGKVVELVERRNNEDVVWRKVGASE